MSYTTIKALWPGEKHEDLKELGNSWGSAPYVWDSIGKRYVDPNFSMFQADKLWRLWKDGSIPKHRRAVLMLTFDRAYVTSVNFGRMAADIAQFLEDFPPNPNHVNHWPEIAATLQDNPEIPAIGLYCTSVSEDPFQGEWNEEAEEYGQIDWSTAFDIYADLDGPPPPRASDAAGDGGV